MAQILLALGFLGTIQNKKNECAAAAEPEIQVRTLMLISLLV